MSNDKWLDDSIQFPRLISELEAAGAFTEEVLSDLSVSMDLEPAEICEVVGRACDKYDEIKRKLKLC